MAEPLSLTAREAAERLLAARSPILVCHVHPDADTYGSAVALASIFDALGKPASIVCADAIPERLRFLDAYLPPKTPVGETRDVIAVDVASPNQLGDMAAKYDGRFTLTIDHHRAATRFSDYYAIPDMSATAEVVYNVAEVLSEMGKLPEILPVNVAAPLYAALASDTGCFKYSSVTPRTLRVASTLLESGIDGAEICHHLFDEKSPAELRAERLALNRMRTLANGEIALLTVTKRDREAENLSLSDLETSIDVLRSLRGVRIAAVLKETEKEDKVYKVSIRSTDCDVSAVAARFGGGGHIHAAGCSLSGTPDAAEADLLRAFLDAGLIGSL